MQTGLARLFAVLLLASPGAFAGSVQEVRAGDGESPAFPEDLFSRPPGAWAFASHLWKGDDPCTAESCEAGYTVGDLALSVARYQTSLTIVAGFRGCANVAWNNYEIGDKASKRDTKAIVKRISKTVAASAEYCKLAAPEIPPLDASRLYPPKP